MPGLNLPNPELVQTESWTRPHAASGATTPVFLIHDGGGTTFAYNCLPPLGRFVYGIRNPRFWSGQPFAGGLPEMARLYAAWVRAAAQQPGFPARRPGNPDGSVDVLLGGWSLGGMLSLEVARELEGDEAVRVVGIVMVDSMYPFAPPAEALAGVALAAWDTSEEGKTKNQVLSQRAMGEARRMIQTWKLPTWDGWDGGRRPRTVLLRARGYVPTEGEGISRLDLYREDKNLGWGRYGKGMPEEVIDVDGHHFDLFAEERIQGTAAAMRRALDMLD